MIVNFEKNICHPQNPYVPFKQTFLKISYHNTVSILFCLVCLFPSTSIRNDLSQALDAHFNIERVWLYSWFVCTQSLIINIISS